MSLTVIIPPTDVSPTTGTGNAVLATSPTLTTPISATLTSPAATNLTLGTGTYGTALTVASATGAVTATTTLADQGGTIAAQRNGLASAQGLAFNGTGRATATLGTVVGTLDYTFRAKIKVAALTSAHQTAYTLGSGNAMLVRPTTGYILDEGGVYSVGVVAGITSDVAIVRTGGVSYLYINGLLKDQHANTYDFSSSTVNIGAEPVANADRLTGVLSDQLIYNRALSAAEVLALYQSSAPAAADYNTASNTNTVTGWQNYNFSTLTGTSATGFTATSSAGALLTSNPASSTLTMRTGTKWRVKFTATITSGTITCWLRGLSGNFGTFTLSAGDNSAEITMTSASASDSFGAVQFTSAGASNFSVSSFSLTPLGALLAPDSAQVGGGLAWYDTSGNAANITLPATGVSWSLPTSGKAFSLSLASTTAGSSGAGALVVQGGISAGAASYFGGSISFPSDTGIISSVNDGRLFLDGSLNQSGGSIILFGSAHGSFPAHTIYSANTHIYKNISGTQQLSLSLTAATFAGAVSVGTGAAVGGATAGAGGLAFPATAVGVANPNTLDDYEEGTWTPTVAGATTAGTVAYSYQDGYYTKIGRLLYVWFDLEVSSFSGGVGGLTITNLPGTNANIANFYPTFQPWAVASAYAQTYTTPTGSINPNTSVLILYSTDDGHANFDVMKVNQIGRISGYFMMQTT